MIRILLLSNASSFLSIKLWVLYLPASVKGTWSETRSHLRIVLISTKLGSLISGSFIKILKPNAFIYDGRMYFSKETIEELKDADFIFKGVGRWEIKF